MIEAAKKLKFTVLSVKQGKVAKSAFGYTETRCRIGGVGGETDIDQLNLDPIRTFAHSISISDGAVYYLVKSIRQC